MAAQVLFDAAGDMRCLFLQGYRRDVRTAEDQDALALWWTFEHPEVQRANQAFRQGVGLLDDRGVLRSYAPEHVPGYDRLEEADAPDVEVALAACAHRAEVAVASLEAVLMPKPG